MKQQRRSDLERKLKIAILCLACTMFLCLIGTYLIKYTTFKFQVQPKLDEHNEVIEKYVTAFEADRIVVAASQLSAPMLSGSDAGDQLNNQIPWKPASNASATLQLPESISQRLQSSTADWTAFGPDIYKDLDFSWLTKNFDYAFWSIWKSDQVKSFFQENKQVMDNRPSPDYDQLIFWAQLRYLHGLHNNDLLAAQSEIRQLAHLIESNESALATRAALKIYGLEQKIGMNTQAIAAGFEPMPQELLNKVQAMVWFYESAAHPATRDDLIRKITTYKEPHFGLCGVIAHYSWVKSVDVFRPLPFKDTNKIMDKFASTSNCRRQYEEFLYKSPEPTSLLSNHAFLKMMAAHKYSYFLFQDTIGLIIDLASMTDGALYYRQINQPSDH